MTRLEALDGINDLISDCESHCNWDVNDDRNWESMAAVLERIKTYITEGKVC